MLIDGDQLIEKQLTIKTTTEVVFPDGRKTVLTPVSYTPVPDGSFLSLNGAWQVKRWPFGQSEKTLVSPELDDRRWETVEQPGKVFYADPEAHRQVIPNWNRVTQTHIPDRDGAIIRRRVYCPKEWTGKRIYLRFDAIYPAGEVYVNGEKVGGHWSGLTPVEFDVTDKVVPGTEVLIAVRLWRKHRFHKMDMVRHAVEFCGLAQPAYLFATEPVQLSGYHLASRLGENLNSGEVTGTVTVCSYAGPGQGRVELTLLDPLGKQVGKISCPFKISARTSLTLPLSLPVGKPLLWNDEQPHLYTAGLKLLVKNQPEQRFTYRTGFRRLELSPAGPRLNGHFIKFRGVNHLTYHPEGGMYTPREWLRRNLSLMKKANVNAIRTHFLGPACLAELCDELGIYLLQELPIDWGTDYIHDPEWVGPALMRIQGGILRDRHHVSVMVWSVGNENLPLNASVAEDGWNHLRIFNRFCKRLDPERPTMFPPPGPANKIKAIFEVRVGDIADTHYNFSLVKEMHRTGRIANPRSWEG
ncbi:MAG TPA: glycoside hydrolase family 2 TIM barrel-domain containing protein, partial [bacterium]|nr:glycoside hydrolase family 2 TIM barrel-domain containing protein [bacterium]